MLSHPRQGERSESGRPDHDEKTNESREKHHMTDEITDRTGAVVTIGTDLSGPIPSYTVAVDGGEPVGRADFFDSPEPAGGRIFFHTEVNPAFGSRGLAGLLVREALDDSIRQGRMVVPVCPLFAKHLKDHGDEFVSAGGRVRRPTSEDIALIARLRS